MINVILVGIGGFAGAVLRHGVTIAITKLLNQPAVPWGVMAANIAGSFAIGVLAGIGEGRHVFSSEARLFLFVGLLGGFTTFSSVSYETLVLLRATNYYAAFANIGLTVSLGLLAVAIGYYLGRTVP